MTLYCKDPDARIAYAVDWLAACDAGQVIDASLWSVSPEEPGGVAVEAHAFELVRTSVRLAGGIAGHVYRVANRVTLTDGTSDERTLTVRVEQR